VSDVRIETLTGRAVVDAIADLVRLRVSIFRDWPYLYEGSLDYESNYLGKYADLPGAIVVVARAPGGGIVGAATALPLAAAEAELQAPFAAAGIDVASVYYYGESVLEHAWRNRGIGVAFFAAREGRARDLGYKIATFCAVVRPDNHPLRPPGYVPLDAFWGKRGYRRAPGLVAHFKWRDVDAAAATSKPMSFWTKTL
jgi:GNAT superfamily N-acetyltransferase